MKVIFHVDEMSKWGLVLGNTRNLIAALADKDLSVEILANSEAVKFLVLKDQVAENTDALTALSKTVRIVACNNALRAFKIDPASLYDFVTVVPAGVAELVLRQHEGYAYIKP